jgi:hypothetical protein
MALILKDRVKETSSTTGTGTLDLDGAVAGFEGFVSAVGNGNTCYYAIQDANGADWEVGVGTITDATPDTLARNTILASSNADSVVTLSAGEHAVFLTYPAEKSVYRNLNDQVVLTASGVIFSDATVQTTAAVNTTYTAGSGLRLNGTQFYTADTGNFKNITFGNADFISIGDNAGLDSIGPVSVEYIGNYAGAYNKNNTNVSMIGSSAGWASSGNTNVTMLGNEAGRDSLNSSASNMAGVQAGYQSLNADTCDFIGSEAGAQSRTLTQVVAIGTNAGVGATGCSYSQFLGRAAGKDSIGCDTVFMGGRNAGDGALNSVRSVMVGEYAGSLSRNVEFSNLVGYYAGESSSGHHNNYIGFQAGYNADGYNNLEIVNSGANTSILNNTDNKVHIQKLITGDSSTRRVALGNVGVSTLNPNATVEIISLNVNDTGLRVHNLVAVDTGILIASSIPSVTTNKLYNNGGTLYFNGNPVDTDTDTTYSAGDGLNLATTTFSVDNTVARSGGNISQFVNNSGYLNAHPVISAASSSNNSGRTYIQDILLDSNGHVTSISTATETVTDTDTTYSAGSGLQLAGTTFNVQDNYLRNDANDTTTGVITSAGISTTGNITGGIVTVSKAIKTSNKSNADSTTITFDLNESNFHTVTLGGNRTLALSNPTVGQKFAIRLQQDVTGNRTVTWFSTIRWPDNTVPTLSSTGNKADLFGFVCTSGGQYDGFGIGYNL